MTDHSSEIVWRGRQWRVTTCGDIEGDDDDFSDYSIGYDDLADEDNGDWLDYMSHKHGVDLEDFIAAYCIAVAVAGIKIDCLVGKIIRARFAKIQHDREEAMDRRAAE